MKKHLLFKFLLTFCLSLFLSVGWVNAQNLILNGDFELWDDLNTPTSWTKVESITQETTIFHGGANSAKHIGGTKDLGQTITVDPNTWYLVTIWYYVESGDGSDARIWSFFQDASDTRLDDIPALLGPDNGYFNSDASWQKYEATVLSPADAASLYFEVRTYSGATVYWDDISVVETTAPPASIVNAKYVSETALDVIYDMSQTTVDPADYNLTGTTAITFSGATIDGTDDKIVHLTGASASIIGDGTLDNIADASANLDFYAGITPIEYTNTNNLGGTITDGIDATFTGIISANDGFNNVWIADAEGAYNGIMIFDYDFDGNVAVGDSVLFTATRTTSNNLSQLENPVLLNNIASGKTPYGPSAILGSQIENTISADTDPGETWEGQLVKIVNAEITVDVNTSDGGGHYYYTATDDNSTTSFAIGDNVDYQFGNISFMLNDDVTITGVVDFDYGKYRINPRDMNDIVSATDTVGSAVYAVDQGLMEITDIPFSTDLATFESNIEAADSATFDVFDADGTTPATVLDDTKLLIVTAADGITEATYTITKNAVLTDATVTSTEYTVVDGTPGTISNIPFGTDLATFKSNITAPQYGTFEVYESDGGAVATDLQDGYFLTGVAEDGTTEADYNIEISSVVPDEDSDASAPTTQVAAATVAVVDGDTEGEAFEVFSFDINDAGTSDGVPTNVSQMVLFYGPNFTLDLETEIDSGWFEVDGTPVDFDGDPVAGLDSIAFSFAEGQIEIPDGGSVNVVLKLFLSTSVADGKVVQFMIDADQHGFETTGISSEFAATFTGGDITGNNISIDAVATELAFSTEPTDVYIDNAIDPAVIVEAVDANGNLDTDYTEDVTISSSASTATLSGTLTVAAVNGVATFSDLSFDAAEDNVTLSVTDGTINGGPSASINITVEPEKDLFFSEYIEGSSNNKALEIYNPTGADVDLTPYVVKLASNGGDWNNTLDLTGTLVAGEVYIIANSGANQAILDIADITSNVTYYNGNDALGLFKSDALIDAIGTQGVDVTWDVAGVAGATAEHTLIRKSGVTVGNTDWTASAGTNTDDSEWEVYDQDYLDDLGTHSTTLSNEAEILSFTFGAAIDSADAVIESGAATVDITVINGTDVTALTPTITVSDGATIDPASEVEQDFTNPVVYTVTAEDGTTTKDWTVTVSVSSTLSDQANITNVELADVDSININETDTTVTIYAPFGFDVTSVKPEFTVSAGATIADTATARDFTNPQVYVVTAQDGTTIKNWEVSIDVVEATAATIYDIQYTDDESGDSPYLGQIVLTSGIVTYINGSNVWIQDGSGAWNGVMIYSTDMAGAVAIGDEVEFAAEVDEYYNLTELKNVVNLTIVSSDNDLPAAAEITTLEANDEDYESVLVKVSEATCTNVDAGYGMFVVDDGSGEILVDDVFYAFIPTLDITYDITGIADYSFSDRKILPRSEADIVEVTTGINNPDGIVSMNVYPNPSNGAFTLEMNASKAGTFNVEIINLQGQVIYQKQISQDGFYQESIDISEKARGIYYIRINDGTSMKISKIIIQ